MMADASRFPAQKGTAPGLLATKLHAPGVRSGFVARARLIDTLDADRGGGLTLVCAPAGFGKTALLADWSARSDRPVAWLALDRADSDLARFWRHVAGSVGRVRPGVLAAMDVVLGSRASDMAELAAAALISSIEGSRNPCALVLDDCHRVESAAVHASMSFLLEHLPPSLSVVIASRGEPPLPLGRMRAGGRLIELRADQLRCTIDEARALLRNAIGFEPAATEVASLVDRTEGWAAGLQLAALSLRGRSDGNASLGAFGASHRFVRDYLIEEVFTPQAADVREFLLETAILGRLSGPLCDAVLGRSGSQARLETMERAGLFLVPLDDTGGWWRYHRLFAGVLQGRIAAEAPERVRELHGRASAWFDAHGFADEALEHARAARVPVPTPPLAEHRRGRFHLRMAADADEPFAPATRHDFGPLTLVPTDGESSWATNPATETDLVEPLSQREVEVLRLLAVGKPNRVIADELFVTVDTVKKHVTHILGKLEVANRTEAAVRARGLGLVA